MKPMLNDTGKLLGAFWICLSEIKAAGMAIQFLQAHLLQKRTRFNDKRHGKKAGGNHMEHDNKEAALQ